MMRGRFVQIGGQAGRGGQGQRQRRLGAGGRPRRDLRRTTAGRLGGGRGRMVAGRLFRPAAGLDGEGGRGGPWPPRRRHGRRQRARARHRGQDRQPAQGQLAQLRDQFRAGLFAQHVQGRAVHRTRLRGVAGGRRAGSRGRASARDGARIPDGRQRPGARSAGDRRSAGRQARAGDPRRDRRRADDLGPGARGGARGQSPRPARRRDHPQNPRRDARTADRDVPDRICAPRRGDRRVRRRRGGARRLSGRDPHHAVRLHLRLGRRRSPPRAEGSRSRSGLA